MIDLVLGGRGEVLNEYVLGGGGGGEIGVKCACPGGGE